VSVSGVAADSLGARRIGDIAYAVATRTGVRSVLVSDEDIVKARQILWDEYRIVVEHGAATAVAALTSGVYQPANGERFAVVLCGANTDPQRSRPRPGRPPRAHAALSVVDWRRNDAPVGSRQIREFAASEGQTRRDGARALARP
jgi:threonine dehydratase